MQNSNQKNILNRNNAPKTSNFQRNEFEELSDEIKKNAPKLLNPQQDPNGKLLFEYAEKVGKKIRYDGVTVSQIRKIYSEVKKLKYDAKGEYQYNLRLIKAQIGYTAGRFSRLKNFKNVFDILIQETVNGGEAELKRFKDFFEAVIAYHRAYGGN